MRAGIYFFSLGLIIGAMVEREKTREMVNALQGKLLSCIDSEFYSEVRLDEKNNPTFTTTPIVVRPPAIPNAER